MLTSKKEKEFRFTGPLAGVISHFFEDMRLSGRVYNAEGYFLQRLSHDAEEADLETDCMTKEFVETWCQKREYESHKTWSNRVIVIRRLADYMDLRGMSVYKPSIMIPVMPVNGKILNLNRTNTPAADGVISFFSASCTIPAPVSRNWPI